MVISHLPNGPTAYFTLHNVLARHDLPDTGKMSLQLPHLIFENFTSSLGKRVESILKYLFPVPKETSTRVVTFCNEGDFVRFRHHVYVDAGGDVSVVEVGPRFEMQGR
jgi:U3 small nucleolar ribonucleoprotein protein IMP4